MNGSSMIVSAWILIDAWTDKSGHWFYARIGVDSHGHTVEPIFATKKAAYAYIRERKISKGFRPVLRTANFRCYSWRTGRGISGDHRSARRQRKGR